MKSYHILVEDMVSQEFSVQAEDEKEALALARERYRQGKWVLEPGHLESVDFRVLSPEEEMA